MCPTASASSAMKGQTLWNIDFGNVALSKTCQMKRFNLQTVCADMLAKTSKKEFESVFGFEA